MRSRNKVGITEAPLRNDNYLTIPIWEYVLPFHVGALWGADPEDQGRADGMYQWNIDGKTDVKVPAGKFKGCYDILFRTMPDHEERWICPGVGLTSLEYEHNGTVHHYLIELQSYSIGTPVLSQK